MIQKDVENLISGFSASSKSGLNMWMFMVHVLLKPGLENLEHYLLACEMSAIVHFGIGFLWNWYEN